MKPFGSIATVGERGLGLTPRSSESLSFLAPMAPDRAAEKLDEALHGKRADSLMITPQSVRRQFVGGVQQPAFWVQSKGASLNPMERRVDGMLVANSGSTEVQCALRKRGAATATVAIGAGTLGVLSVFLVPVAILTGAVPWLGGTARLALLTLLVGLWALFFAAIYAAKRVAADGERTALRFVAAALEAPDRDLLGL